MIKFEFTYDFDTNTLKGNKLIKDKVTPLSEKKIYDILNRIDLYRNQQFFREDIQGNERSIRYIDKNKIHNVKIYNAEEVFFRSNEITKEEQKEVRKIKKIIAGASIVIGLTAVGTGALFDANKTVGLTFDPEGVSEEYEEEAKKERTSQIDLSEIKAILETGAQIGQTGQDIAMTAEQLMAPEDTYEPINIEVEPMYSQELEDNLDQINDIIVERGSKWGIHTNLMRKIIAQESSGGVINNVGQFEFDQWPNPFVVHNYQDGTDVTVLFSNEEQKRPGVDIQISEADLQNIETQVSVVGIVYQYMLNKYNKNIPIATQGYHEGEIEMDRLLAQAAEAEGCTVADFVNNEANTAWIKYCPLEEQTNSPYVENVFKHVTQQELESGEILLEVSVLDENGNAYLHTNRYKLCEYVQAKGR